MINKVNMASDETNLSHKQHISNSQLTDDIHSQSEYT